MLVFFHDVHGDWNGRDPGHDARGSLGGLGVDVGLVAVHDRTDDLVGLLALRPQDGAGWQPATDEAC